MNQINLMKIIITEITNEGGNIEINKVVKEEVIVTEEKKDENNNNNVEKLPLQHQEVMGARILYEQFLPILQHHYDYYENFYN